MEAKGGIEIECSACFDDEYVCFKNIALKDQNESSTLANLRS